MRLSNLCDQITIDFYVSVDIFLPITIFKNCSQSLIGWQIKSVTM